MSKNWNVIKTEMSLKLKCHQNWNATKTEMSPKLKCHQNWNVTKTAMSTKLKCLHNWNIIFKNLTKLINSKGLLTPWDHVFAEPQHSSPQLPEYLSEKEKWTSAPGGAAEPQWQVVQDGGQLPSVRGVGQGRAAGKPIGINTGLLSVGWCPAFSSRSPMNAMCWQGSRYF